MSRSPHCAIRWLIVLAIILFTTGCGGDLDAEVSGGQDVPDPEDVSDSEPDAPTTEPDVLAVERDLSDGHSEDTADVEGDALSTLPAPDAAPDVSLPTGPPEDLPSDKATWGCQVDAECAGCAGPGTCFAGACRYQGDGCVIGDADGEWASCVPDATSAPDSTCLQCTASVAANRWSGLWASADFEGGLPPFGAEVLGSPEVVWSVTPVRPHGGMFAAYFGDKQLGTYESSGRSWGRISLPFIDASNGLSGTLRFWLWLQTEQTPGFDVLRVLAVRSKDSDVLWTSDSIGGTTEGEWVLVEVDVTGQQGVPTQLAIEFDTVDDILNDLEGPYIDGVTFATGCCTADADCVSTNACLAGSCGVDGLCSWSPVEGCCNRPADCQTTGPCFEPVCSGPGGICSELPIENCCETAADCDDEDPCTKEMCPWPGAICEHANLCCMEDNHCFTEDPCLTGTCVEDECVYIDKCCETVADCVHDDPCTVPACVDFLCFTTLLPVEGCCVESIYRESFDSGLPLAGWSLAGMTNGVGWSVAAPEQSGLPSPPGALYYGNPDTWTYSSGGVNHGKVRLPFITLPLGVEVTLSFAVFLDVQTSGALDIFEVQVNGPSGWQKLSTKGALILGQWQTVTIDLSALAGQSVQLAFKFDTVDAFENDGLGVLIDELMLTTTCAPRPCAVATDCPSTDSCLHGVCTEGSCNYVDSCCQYDGDCDDQNPCTMDTCNNDQACEFEPVIQCCVSPVECDDGDLCTLDVCTSFGGSCINPPIDGCCHDSSECDDAEVCTADQCLDNVCAHSWQCCASDAECDDGDDVCTIDDCVDGFCVNAPSGLAGCCLTDPVQWDFEAPVAFDFTATEPPCGWMIGSVGDAWAGSGVLYYGNPAAMNFACGWNAGMATSPEITLMDGFAYTLTFAANLDVESNDIYDTLELYALLPGDQQLLLWDKSQMPSTDTWYVYTIDLGALAGKTFRLRFDFDTHDEISNESDGIYIDDIHISSTCLAKPCSDDMACIDELEGTTESCGIAGCEYTIP